MGSNWIEKMNKDPRPWLMKQNPWTRYCTSRDLTEDQDEAQSRKYYDELEQSPIILEHLDQVSEWFPHIAKRHDDAALSHYRLKMLIQLGLDLRTDKIVTSLEKALQHFEEGFPTIRQDLPVKKGKTPNSKEWNSLPCDTPVILTAYIKAGYKSPQISEATDKLASMWKDTPGWFCNLFFVKGQFKREQAACPMAALQMLELFDAAGIQDSTLINTAFEGIDYHRKLGKSLYYFGRGTKFWTMKFPFVWYNALYMADVVSRFSTLHHTELMQKLVKWILESQDESGRYKASSMFRAYKGFDFADKKQASGWISYLNCRILKRVYH